MDNIKEIQHNLDIFKVLVLKNETSIMNNCESIWSKDSLNYIWTEIYEFEEELKITNQQKNDLLNKLFLIAEPIEKYIHFKSTN